MHKPPRIQVQFLVEPPDAPIVAEYDRPLPKFIFLNDFMNAIFEGILTGAALFVFMLIVIIGSALGRIHR